MPLDVRPRPSLGQLSLWTALLCVAVAPLALGAVHAQVMAVIAAFAHLALLLHVVDRRLAGRSLRFSWLGLPVVLGLGFTWFQLLPLPRLVRGLLSPEATRRVAFVTEPLPPALQELVRPVLSLDPPDTALAALRISSALCIFMVLASRCQRRDGRQLAYRVLLAAALTLVVVTAAHKLLALDAIYGVWEPSTQTLIVSPLINPNHAARVFGALGLMCLGRALYLRPRAEWLWFLAGALSSLAFMLLEQSYGAVLALLVGLVTLISFRARLGVIEKGRGEVSQLSPKKVAAVLLTCVGAALGFLVVISRALSLNSEADGAPLFQRSKLALYEPALEALLPFWRVGAGNNAFQPAFASSVQPGAFWNDVTVSHPENVVLQVLFDHGVILGVVLMIAAGWVAARLVLAAWSGVSLPAAPALLFLVFGELADFSLEVGFGALLAACLLGMCAAELGEEYEAKLTPRRSAALVVVLLLAAAWFGSVAVTDPRFSIDKRISLASSIDRTTTAQRAVARHPSDAYYAYVLATSARIEREPDDALQWITRAMYLQPSFADAHIEAARVLWALGRVDQALLEYRLAVTSGSRSSAVEELSRRPIPYARMRSVVEGNRQARDKLCYHLQVRRPKSDDLQSCLDDGAAAGDPDAAIAATRAALARRDVSGARARIDTLLGGGTPDGNAAVALVQVVTAEISRLAAFEESAALLPKMTKPAALLEWRVDTAIRLERFEEAQRDLETLRRQPGRKKDVIWLDLRAARVAQATGDLANALTYLRRVLQRRPRDVGALVEAADACLELGLSAEAARYIERARAQQPSSKHVRELSARLKETEDQSRFKRLKRIYEGEQQRREAP